MDNYTTFHKRLFLIFVILQVCQSALISINKEFVGVVFSPHVRSTGNVWDWNNYSTIEVEAMLEIVSKHFRNISTFGVGAKEVGMKRWDTGEAVGFTGIVAANLNRKLKRTAISVAIAVWRHDDSALLNTEIEKAIEIAKKANDIHQGSVWGITFSSNYVIDSNTATLAVELIEAGRKRALENKLVNVKLGIRLEICSILANPNVDSAFLHLILWKADFVLCIIFPPAEVGRVGVSNSVEYLTQHFLQIQEAVKMVNGNVQIIFESGWPSMGIDKNFLLGSIQNLEQFWNLMASSAANNKLHLNLFEAFDAPWKSYISSSLNVYNGPCGAEGHFGWWRRINDSLTVSSAYAEKINVVQIPLCENPPNVTMSKKPKIPESTQSLLLAISIFVLIVSVLVISKCYQKSTTKKVEVMTEQILKEFENGVDTTDGETEHNVDLALQLPYDRNYEKDRNQFKIYTRIVLGSGQFGIVYKGKILESDLEVAFKTTKPNSSTGSILNLLMEIKLMIYIGSHPNIVKLLGACTSEVLQGKRVLIAMEYCSKGSLEKVLREIAPKYADHHYVNVVECENEFTSDYSNLEKYVNSYRLQEMQSIDTTKEYKCMERLVTWSYDIAKGMEHLHAKRVIHADVATRNVLVSENGIAKITDFGLSRKMYAYEKYVKKKQEPLPWRWMAIESLQRLSFSTASDVWSYGVTLWEIFSLGEIPYPGINWEIDFLSKLKNGMRLEKPIYATDEIYKEMQNCWAALPEKRPKFVDLVTFFETILNKFKEK